MIDISKVVGSVLRLFFCMLLRTNMCVYKHDCRYMYQTWQISMSRLQWCHCASDLQRQNQRPVTVVRWCCMPWSRQDQRQYGKWIACIRTAADKYILILIPWCFILESCIAIHEQFNIAVDIHPICRSQHAGYEIKKTLEGETYVSNLKCFRVSVLENEWEYLSMCVLVWQCFFSWSAFNAVKLWIIPYDFNRDTRVPRDISTPAWQVNEMHEVERLVAHASKKRSVGCTASNSQVQHGNLCLSTNELDI